MPAPLSDAIIRQIYLHAELLQHPDGTPNQSAIAKELGISLTTVHNRLKRNPQRPNHIPNTAMVEKVKEQLWQETQDHCAQQLMKSHKQLVNRWKEVLENDLDARDVRHMAQALDTNVKTLSLITGGVTSRTQQSQTHDHTVKHEVIKVPAKDTAAFQVTTGLKGELPEHYDVSDDQDHQDAPGNDADANDTGDLPTTQSHDDDDSIDAS